jgi:hypothetical protein
MYTIGLVEVTLRHVDHHRGREGDLGSSKLRASAAYIILVYPVQEFRLPISFTELREALLLV